MSNVLVIGANGMAGHAIALYLEEKDHCVTSLTRQEISITSKNIKCDVTDFSAMKNIIQKNDFDYIVNAVGILNQFAEANKPQAILINSYLAHFLADCVKEINTRIIHLSTDCVFSGKKGNYRENDIKDGKTFYDQSKSLGELEDEKNLTFRNSIIGPDLNPEGIGLFNWFMKQSDSIQGYDCAYWSGVTTLVLAEAIHCAMKQKLVGLYQLSNNEKISKFQLLKLMNRIFKNDSITIKRNTDFKIDKSLINTRTDFDFTVPSYETMLLNMKKWVDTHSGIYNEYQKFN